MTAKEYLSQARKISTRLKSFSRNLLSLQEALTNVTPQRSVMPRPATTDVHKLEKLVAAKVDLEKRMEKDAAKLADIYGAINSLQNPIHTVVLTNRYIAGMEWLEIASELKYSKSQIHRLHRDALSEIEKTIHGGT